MNARDSSSIKPRFCVASTEIKPNTYGPARIPVNRKPLIRGSRALVKNPPICFEARAITVKPTKKMNMSR